MMKQPTATNIEQSKRVLACGIDRSTADMYFSKATMPPAEYYLYPINDGINAKEWFSVRTNRDIIPSWSLAALISVLPSTITTDRRGDFKGRDYGFKLFPDVTATWWLAGYVYEPENDYKYLTTSNENAIEAVVQLIETLYKEYGKIPEGGRRFLV